MSENKVTLYLKEEDTFYIQRKKGILYSEKKGNLLARERHIILGGRSVRTHRTPKYAIEQTQERCIK